MLFFEISAQRGLSTKLRIVLVRGPQNGKLLLLQLEPQSWRLSGESVFPPQLFWKALGPRIRPTSPLTSDRLCFIALGYGADLDVMDYWFWSCPQSEKYLDASQRQTFNASEPSWQTLLLWTPQGRSESVSNIVNRAHLCVAENVGNPERKL